MELKYQKNLTDFVTEKQLQKRNAIVEKWNENGYLSKTDGEFLCEFDKKTRVCNQCGKTFKEAKGWAVAKANDKAGKEVPCGLHSKCFECEVKEIMAEGIANGW